jgi:hypothetical protein
MTSGGNHQCLPDRSAPSRKTCGDSSDLMIADEVIAALSEIGETP